MNLSRRSILAAAAAAIALGASACGAPASPSATSKEATPVNIGYIPDYNGTALISAADKQGLWEKHGLKPSYKSFTNGPLQIQALQTKDLDFGYIGPGALWLPASGKAKVVSIVALGIADKVIAQPGINSIADLRGKTVGVPEGTSGDMLLRMALEKAGMTINDVKKTPMDPTTIVTAFVSKQIDAAGIWYPLIDNIKAKVPDLLELASNEDFSPDYSFPSSMVTGPSTDNKPEVISKFQAVMKEANTWVVDHPDDAVKTSADFMKLPVDQVKTQAPYTLYQTTEQLEKFSKDGTIEGWLKGLNKQFSALGKLQNPQDPKTYYLGDSYVNAK